MGKACLPGVFIIPKEAVRSRCCCPQRPLLIRSDESSELLGLEQAAFLFFPLLHQSLSMTEQIWLQTSGCEAYFLICLFVFFFPLGGTSQTNTWCLTKKTINLLNARKQIQQASQSPEMHLSKPHHLLLAPAPSCSPVCSLSILTSQAWGLLSHLWLSFTQKYVSPHVSGRCCHHPSGHTLWYQVPHLHQLLLSLSPKWDGFVQWFGMTASALLAKKMLTPATGSQLCSPCGLPPDFQGDLDSVVSGDCSG